MDEEATATGRNHGEQPLDELMKRWHLTNHDLVEISPEQLTHKQVQKARAGAPAYPENDAEGMPCLECSHLGTAHPHAERAVLRIHAQACVQHMPMDMIRPWKDPNMDMMA